MMVLRSSLKKSIDNYKIEFLESLEDLRGYSDLTIKSYASIKDIYTKSMKLKADAYTENKEFDKILLVSGD